MSKIIITGANGQLGRAMQKEFSGSFEHELILTDVGPAVSGAIRNLDITKVDEVLSFCRAEKPDIIVNCAAYTAVDRAESDWDNAYRINAVGPRNLAIASRETGASLVHISTDYVFNGEKPLTETYDEFDTPDPKGAYGKTKLAGEEFVKTFADRFFIFRTAWLYGDGKNFVKTMLRLSEDHEEISVVCDQVGPPTSAKELASAIISQMFTDNYGLFHGVCEGFASWAEFTEEIFRLTGKTTRVKHITAAEYGAAAPRPSNSRLTDYMLKLTSDHRFPDWHDALSAYLKEFGLL
ncbi:MAG: dTDP-4-dehydrorhamnose reductase [Lachnospiraceae bacterium]|nr:dTDP-4-dehydrorhamnose reductase [Lachnospiraceae bacterium]